MKYTPYGETRHTWGSTPTDHRFAEQPGSIAQTLLAEYRMYLERNAETP